MDFIKNYIALMRIRLSSNVTVETRFDIRPDSPTEIAPLIFISLIENAFKHGISPTEPSYIRIYFSESADEDGVKSPIATTLKTKPTRVEAASVWNRCTSVWS